MPCDPPPPPGTVLRNNRRPHITRTLRARESDGWANLTGGGWDIYVHHRNIYNDDKPRRSGWSVVKENPDAA